MSLKLENNKNNFSNIIMEINMIQKRKHLLLLNRIMRNELKKDIIKTPSKITDEEVDKYFTRLFVKKDDYYIPIKSKIEINIDEELFKNLIKKPKKKEVKEVEKPKEKEVKKVKEVKEVEKPKEEEVKKTNEKYLSIPKIISDYALKFNKFRHDNFGDFIKSLGIVIDSKFKVYYELIFDESRKYREEIYAEDANENFLNAFDNLIKHIKKVQNKEVEKPKEEVKEVEKPKEEQIKEFYDVFNLYNYDYIYDNLSKIYKKKGIAFILNKLKKEMFYNVSIQKQILQTLSMKNKLLYFLNKMKDYKQKKDEPEKTKKFEEEQIKFKQLQQVNDKEEVKKSKDNDIAEFFKGKIKFNVIGK